MKGLAYVAGNIDSLYLDCAEINDLFVFVQCSNDYIYVSRCLFIAVFQTYFGQCDKSLPRKKEISSIGYKDVVLAQAYRTDNRDLVALLHRTNTDWVSGARFAAMQTGRIAKGAKARSARSNRSLRHIFCWETKDFDKRIRWHDFILKRAKSLAGRLYHTI